MTRLTRLSLGSRAVVLLLSLVVMGLGWYATRALKQELIPAIERPRSTVITVYPGASPQAVERDVTKPLEDAAKGVAGITQVTSSSASGISQVRVEWDFGSNDEKIRNDVATAVESARASLPNDITPRILAGSFDDVPVVVMSVSSPDEPAVLARKVRDIALPKLRTIAGVREAAVSGDEKREVAVTLRPGDVERFKVPVATLPQLFQASGTGMPAGSIPSEKQTLDVQVGRAFASVADVKRMQVPTQDGPVELRDIADVREQAVETTSISRANGEPSLTLAVVKEQSGNTVTVSQAVRDALPGIQAQLGEGTRFSTVFDQAPYIEDSIHDLSVEGGLGLLFAVLVILLFLTSLRPTLITAISIPTSLVIALIGLWAGGYTLNILTLGALTVAIGRVVDDSIVVIENIKRHHGLGERGPGAIVQAVREVAGAITSSTLTTVAVFLPIAMVSGQTGALFRPFAVTVTIALLASLLVSLTLIPVLASFFMTRRAPASGENAGGAQETPAVGPSGETDVAGVSGAAAQTPEAASALPAGTTSPLAEEASEPTPRLQRSYLPALHFALGHRVLTLVLAFLVFLGTLALAPNLKTDFIGEAGETTLQISQSLPTGTTLQQTDKASARLEELIRTEPSVESYQTTIGGSPDQALFGAVQGANEANMSVTLKPGSKGSELASRLRSQVEGRKDLGTVEVAVGGGTNEVSVRLEGADPARLRTGSDQLVAALRRIEHLENVKSDLTDEKAMLDVSPDGDAAAEAGMTPVQIGQAVQQAVKGAKVATLALADTTLDVVLRSRTPVTTVAELENLELPVTQKQDADAKKAASERVEARQKAAAQRQQADARAQAAEQTRQIEAGAVKARQQEAQIRAQLQELRTSLARLDKAAAALAAQAAQAAAQLPVVPPGAAKAAPTGAPSASAAAPAGTGAQGGAAATAPALPKDLPSLAGSALDPRNALRQQIAQLEAGLAQARAASAAASEQAAKARQAQATALQRANEAEELQQAAKDAASATGTPLRLRDVAVVKEVLAPASIGRVDGARAASVTATPTGSDLGATTGQIQEAIANTTLPEGVTATIGGVSQQQQESFAQLGVAMLVAVAVVYLIMVATFGSLVQPLILLVSIPFAATGALGLLLATNTPLGIPAMVGLLMLIGIVVTNAIVLIDLINQYRRRGAGVAEAIHEGARHRLRPIIMTALATICALLPMAFGITGGGVFISKPLALVVIGGLVSSTVLTLILVPVLYDMVERGKERRRARSGGSTGADDPTGEPGRRRRLVPQRRRHPEVREA